MRLIVILCGNPSPDRVLDFPQDAEIIQASEVPTRPELKPLDAAAAEVLPVDGTPSLEEIAAQPDVEHLSTPQRPPQQPSEELRVIVIGSDAALSAVLTRMMRGDYLWATVGFVPTSESTAATTWSLPSDVATALRLAIHGQPRPAPVIRTDTGVVVAGHALITDADNAGLDAEVIVDDAVLAHPNVPHNFGARLVPQVDAPGIAAARMITPAQVEEEKSSVFGRWLSRNLEPQHLRSWKQTPGLSWMAKKAPTQAAQLDPRSIVAGRAVQAGGKNILVTIDGVAGRRPVKRVTFYRHLRDLQIVRL